MNSNITAAVQSSGIRPVLLTGGAGVLNVRKKTLKPSSMLPVSSYTSDSADRGSRTSFAGTLLNVHSAIQWVVQSIYWKAKLPSEALRSSRVVCLTNKSEIVRSASLSVLAKRRTNSFERFIIKQSPHELQ